MAIVWCSISAHGFGHAAQVIPLLNALGETVQGLHVILRTGVPSAIFREHLHISWQLQAVPQDVGCVQRGPIEIDVDNTWAAYQEFHDTWNQRVDREVQAMSEVKPHLVISNISYLAIASAFQANCQAVAIASLSWDQVLQELKPPLDTKQRMMIEHMQKEYVKAQCLIRLHPGICMPAFVNWTDVRPSFPLITTSSKDVKKLLGIASGERLVLVAFGGVPLATLPLKRMESCAGVHFLVAGFAVDSSFKSIHRVEDVPLSVSELIRQVDVVMTKPGYATVVSAVHYGVPLLYVRRYNFIDEQPLVDYAHRYGRALELTREQFEAGDWERALQRVMTLPIPSECPPAPEPHAAACLLKEYLPMNG